METSNFELNFSHFANVDLNPKLYYIDHEQGSKNLISRDSKTTKGLFTNNKWVKTHGIKIKDMIRLDW